MPKYGPHLKGIEKKVHNKITELGLVPKYIFDAKKHQERFYTAPCKNKKGEKVIFKMRTEDYKETKEFFRREIRINQLFTKSSKKTGNLSVPKFIKGDAEHVPEWMVYEFIEGYESGDFYNGFEIRNIKKFSIDSFIDAMKSVHKMPIFRENGAGLKLTKETYKDFKKAYQKNKERLLPFFSEKEIGKAGEVLESYKGVIDKESDTLTHGDFHPGNLIITPQKEVAIIDWYFVHLNNAAFDIAFLYLEITDKKFRDKLLHKFVEELVENKEEFMTLFRLDILRLAPQKINVLYDALYTKDAKREDYYSKLTPKGIAKLETNIAAFEKALYGVNFL
ncbi:MAG: phosphotransferase [Candidatus Pacebacteria bacterium]|nr:phosphotransferase [Candidatus Paceibacterota bacterium]